MSPKAASVLMFAIVIGALFSDAPGAILLVIMAFLCGMMLLLYAVAEEAEEAKR